MRNLLLTGMLLAAAAAAQQPNGRLFVGTDAGVFAVFDRANLSQPLLRLKPYATGGVFVAAGDVDGDGVDEIVTGPSGDAGPVLVFTQNGGVWKTIDAFPGFTGGVRVAAGDVNGDGKADVIVGAGPGAPGGHVKVFDGNTGLELRSFFAFPPNFTGGVSVATGDVNGDGTADIIVGSGAGAAGGHVKVFNGRTGAELASFFAYGTGFSGGVRVASGDLNGDGRADIITGAGPGAGPHVKVFDGATGAQLASFFAFTPGFRGGVNVAAGPVIVAPGEASDQVSAVRIFGEATGPSWFVPFPGYRGGLTVAASQ